jgi:hypothetical protein
MGIPFPAALFLGQTGRETAERMRLPAFGSLDAVERGQTFGGRMMHGQERKVSAGY